MVASSDLKLLQENKQLRAQVARLENENRRANAELVEIRQLYLTAPVGLCLTDANDRFVRINDQLAVLNGHSVEDHIGASLREIIPDVSEKVESFYRQVIENGKPILDVEVTAITSAHLSTERSYLASFLPAHDDTGSVIGVNTVVQDITDRKEAEKIAHQKSELLRQIISVVPHSIFWKDADSVYLGCNERAAQDLAILRPEDIIGKTDFETCVTREQAQHYVSCDRKVVENGEPILNVEEQQQRPDGTEAVLLTSKVPLRDASGDIIGVLGIYSDITERKEEEQALQESEDWLRTIVDHAPEAIVVLDADTGSFVDANKNAENLFGLDRASLLQVGPIDQSPPIQPDGRPSSVAASEKIADALSGGTPVFDWIHRSASGDDIPCEVRLVRLPKAGRNLLRGSIMDISDRIAAEVALRKSEERSRLLLDSTAEAIYGLDKNGNCTFCNPACLKMLGYEQSAELIGKNMHELIHHTRPCGKNYPLHESRIYQAFRRGVGTHVTDEVLWRADGTSFPAEYWSYPIHQDGEVVGAVMTFLDITERRVTEEQLAGFGRILDDSQNEIYIFDAESLRFLQVNQGARNNLGYTMTELQGLTPLHLKPKFTADAFAELIRPLHTGEQSAIEFETIHRRKDGSCYAVEVHLQLSSFQGSPAYVAIILDITRRLRTEKELVGHKQTLALLASGASLELVMQTLVEAAEATMPEMFGSVLILDRKTNRFIETYAPNLPDFYNDAIVGLSIGDGVGSCGTAAYTGQRVIVEDVMTHPYWASYRDLAEKAGLRACWSEPIISTTGEILGTFAMYYREPRGPEDHEMTMIRTTAQIAALAIEQRQNDEAIKNAHDRLEKRVEERTAELVTANRRLKAAMEGLESEGQLLRRLIGLQEEDRRMAAHDIHDGFLQYAQAAHMHVQAMTSTTRSDANESTSERVGSLLRKAITEGRRLIRDLRPIVLDDEGIVEAIRHLIADGAGLAVSFDHGVQFDRLDPKLEGAIFRIVQESLNNVKKHGQTDHAAVQLKQQNGMLDVVIRDHGVGFNPEKVQEDRFGLRGIRERARLFGGTAEIESAPDEGTIIRVQIPVLIVT